MLPNRSTIGVIALLIVSASAGAQIRSSLGKLPDNPPNQVEVRFSVDKKAVTCDQFSLKVAQGNKSIVDGKFGSSFDLPAGEPKSGAPTLEVTIGCSGYVWHFDRVPTAMFQRGWWFVGTDSPLSKAASAAPSSQTSV